MIRKCDRCQRPSTCGHLVDGRPVELCEACLIVQRMAERVRERRAMLEAVRA